MGLHVCRRIMPITLTMVLFYFLFSMPQTCALSVREGIALCGNVIIPSLFLFFVLSHFVLESGLSAQLGFLLAKPCAFLFHISKESVSALLMSLLGGYPIGISMVQSLYGAKKISQKEAQMLCLFLFQPGPAFVIFALGVSMLHSMKAGILLYSSTLCASLILGLFFGHLHSKTSTQKRKQIQKRTVISMPKLSKAISNSIAKASSGMLAICAWVTLFYTITSCLAALPLPHGVLLFLNCILEVTIGLKSIIGVFPLPIFAAILSFGGLSVHCQVLADLNFCGVRYMQFLASRVLSAILSACICFLLLQVFPCELEVFSSTPTLIPQAYSISAPAFFSMLFLSVLLILELDRVKEMC